MKGTNKKQVLLRRETFLAAWREHALNATFAKMDLEQFEIETETPQSIDAQMKAARIKLAGLKLKRDRATRKVQETLVKVADAVRGDVDYGPDCELYRALGYVPKSERKTGLTRKDESKVPSEKSADAA